ncbi:hypothetical protein FGADI_8231 [Fusarium gaditjirri]|uniref:ACB domain-containing protein n=1 Tax=Fusarium gaditjirri TaxID=282569 RepID=A0A8H4T364_9HYPO|nr:hypothetical protein FGADI_8231 [Fusarium gaditjirri]
MADHDVTQRNLAPKPLHQSHDPAITRTTGEAKLSSSTNIPTALLFLTDFSKLDSSNNSNNLLTSLPIMSESFQKAVEDSKKLTSKPSTDDLLRLYGLYKVANGEDFSAATAPGVFDLKASFEGKAKYNAWKKAAEEEKLTPDDAQAKYVELVERLKEKYGYDANKVPEAVGN